MTGYKNKAVLEMLICALLWSTGCIIIKLIPWNPFAIAGVRSFFSAFTVLIYIKITGQSIVLNKTVLISSLFMALAFIAYVTANKLTTAANAIVIQYTLPIFIMIFSVLLFRQKFRTSDIIAVLVTFSGIILFFFDKLDKGNLLGNIVAVFSGMFLSGMYIGMGRTEDENKISITFFGHVFTAVAGMPFILLSENTITPMSLIYVIFLGIFQLGIPYILFADASKTCPPLACSLLSAVEPVLNPVWVLIFNGEKPGPYALVGGIIIIATVTIWSIFVRKEEK